MKNLLLVSLSAGAGHVRAADALEKTAHAHFPGVNTLHLDLADYVNTTTRKACFDSYALLARQLPEVWGFLYQHADQPKVRKRFAHLVSIIQKVNPKSFFQAIDAFEPDVILSTHFIPSGVLERRKDWRKKPRIGTVITDYAMHHLWMGGSDDYFVATDRMAWKLKQRGVDEHRVHVTGIPVDPTFYEPKDATKLKQTYDIANTAPVVLVMAGGHGISKTDKVVLTFLESEKPLTIVAIAGKSTKLKAKLEKLSVPPHISLHIVGWTDAIDEYMRMADLIVTKPGGMTTSECLALGKPMLMIDPVPGQEEHNAEHMLKIGAARIAREPEDLLYTLEHMPPPAAPPKNHAGRMILETLSRNN